MRKFRCVKGLSMYSIALAMTLVLTSCFLLSKEEKASINRINTLLEKNGVETFMLQPQNGESQVVGYRDLSYSDHASGSKCLSSMTWSVRNVYHPNYAFKPSTAAVMLLTMAINDKELPEVTLDNLDEFDVRSVVKTGVSYGGNSSESTSKKGVKTCSYYAYTDHHFQGIIVRVKTASVTPANSAVPAATPAVSTAPAASAVPATPAAPAAPAVSATPAAPAVSSLKNSRDNSQGLVVGVKAGSVTPVVSAISATKAVSSGPYGFFCPCGFYRSCCCSCCCSCCFYNSCCFKS